jgi:copper resistance protein B
VSLRPLLLTALLIPLSLAGCTSNVHRHPLAHPVGGEPSSGGLSASEAAAPSAPGDMAHARRMMAQHMGGQPHAGLFVDRLEYQRHDGESALVWEVDAWYGGDLHKLWFKSDGERSLDPSELEDAEIEVRYSRAVSAFFDVQAGVRRDIGPGPSRSHLAFGLNGLAPHWFELDAAAYLSERGDLTARVEIEYDVLLTQRWILQPRLEIALAAQDVPELEIGSGVGSLDAGLRLRYEFRRTFAPYVGVARQRAFGETRDLLRLAGRETGGTALVAGVRIWF